MSICVFVCVQMCVYIIICINQRSNVLQLVCVVCLSFVKTISYIDRYIHVVYILHQTYGLCLKFTPRYYSRLSIFHTQTTCFVFCFFFSTQFGIIYGTLAVYCHAHFMLLSQFGSLSTANMLVVEFVRAPLFALSISLFFSYELNSQYIDFVRFHFTVYFWNSFLCT